MTENIKKLLKKDFSYPDITKDDFQNKIYEKREFYYHKIPVLKKITTYPELKKYRDQVCGTNFNLQSHQSLLANFINPHTPYRGLLIFHGLGSGKTCAAIAIAENFKDIVQKYNTKIYILVPGPLIKESWKNELIKCTKETYLKDFTQSIGYIDNNEKKNAEKQAKNLTMQFYRIMSHRGFYKKVLGQKIIEHNSNKNSENSKSYRKNEEGNYERDIAIDKIEDLNNTLLIIDEAHKLTGNEYGLAIQKIISNSKNLKVILLTATPMKNRADDIIEIINFLRPINDQIQRDHVFTNERSHLMNFKPGGREYFSKMIQGYISYYRGANPYTFAIQKDQGSIPDGLLFTNLVRCVMNKFQFDVYNDVISNIDDKLDKKSTAVSNFVFPSYSIDNKNIVGIFGQEGLSGIINILKTNKEKLLLAIQKKFNIDDKIELNDILGDYNKSKSICGKIFAKPYLQFFSIKFDTCLTNLLNIFDKYESENKLAKITSITDIKANGAGTAFIFSNLVKVGVELFEQVLLSNGFLEYREDGLYKINDETRDYLTGLSYSDYLQENITRLFFPATFITITGDSDDSFEDIPEEKSKILNNVFSHIDNSQGKYIKFVLGSKVMTEGITLKQIKEIHILDTAYHLGQLQQVIGRGIRFCVHDGISSEENPYPEVNVYRYVVSLPGLIELSSEEILYQKAEKKYLLVKETERLMKESSIDCALNYNASIFENEIQEYQDCISPLEYINLSKDDKQRFKQCPLTCDFKECIYKCYNKKLNLKYYDSTTRLYRKITKDKIDFSTFTNNLARNEIDSCKNIIKEMFRYRYVYNLTDILTQVQDTFQGETKNLFEAFFVYQALDELIPITENDLNNFHDNIYDKFSVRGYLIYRGKYYIFQPFNENEDVPMYYRNNFHSDLVSQLSLYNYLKNTVNIDLLKSLNIEENIITTNFKKNNYLFQDVFEYYDKKKDADYVGIIDKPIARKKTISEDLDDIFKIRKSRAKILKKKRGTGIPSLKGAVCFSSKDKSYLIKIAKKIGLNDIPTETRTEICNAIRTRLLYLEKYSREQDNNKFTWMIIPSNHPKYPFPLNLEDRIIYIKDIVFKKIPTKIDIDIKELPNGIFEDVRNTKFIKYELKFKHKSELEIHSDIITNVGFNLIENFWVLVIE